MKRPLSFVLRLLLLLVIVSEINSIWVGIAHKSRYAAVFPGATGTRYYLTLLTSFAVVVNCIMLWRRRQWAVWLNMLIGLWSIGLIEIVQGPRLNEWIVLTACVTTTVLGLVVLGFRERISGYDLQSDALSRTPHSSQRSVNLKVTRQER